MMGFVSRLTVAIATIGMALAGPPRMVRGQEPTLETVLQRAGQYATDFRRQFAGIVAEEIYVQDVDVSSRTRPAVTHRELKSDLLLVRAEDTGGYVEFRDVVEVDGRAVRDRQERLTDLFLNPRGRTDSFARSSRRAPATTSARCCAPSTRRR